MPCGHVLGKGCPLGSCLWCLTVSLSLSLWYPGLIVLIPDLFTLTFIMVIPVNLGVDDNFEKCICALLISIIYKGLIFHLNYLLADDSNEISSLFY